MKNVSQNVSKYIKDKSYIEENNEEENREEKNEEKNEDNNKEENIQYQDKTQKSQESSQLLALRDKLVYNENEINNNINNNENNNQNNDVINNDENNNINNNEDNNNNNDINIVDNNNNIENSNLNNNSNINNNSSNIYNSNSMSVLDINEEKKLIQSYKDYLAQAETTIDTLLLMKTKNDFMQMIRDKASKFEDANKTMRIIKRFQDKNKKNKINISKSVAIPKENSELEYCADDIENSKENEIQEKIFRTYMNAERKKMERFINNEREGRLIKNKES